AVVVASRRHSSPPTTVHNKPTTQYPSTPGFISNHWYGRWGQVSGTPVQIWDCSGNKNQKWSLGKNGSIIGYGGNCLEAAGDFGANGRSIVMATCNGTQAQTWRIRGQIRSDLNNRCLDDSAGGTTNGARVQMWDCIGNANQTWEVQPS
ncbi:RICIN domain-containing protein, partial [Xanthomonas perforans]|nr:RICIN domain-containing protein [Xanthomonas perforans]